MASPFASPAASPGVRPQRRSELATGGLAENAIGQVHALGHHEGER